MESHSIIKALLRNIVLAFLSIGLIVGVPGSMTVSALKNESFRVGNGVYFSGPEGVELEVGDFVYYSQVDPAWANETYYTGASIGFAGCGPSTLAMILATLLKDPSITPLETARAGNANGSGLPGVGTIHMRLLEGAKKKWSFSYQDLTNQPIEAAMEFVSSGKGFVYMGGRGPAPFTGSVAQGTGGHIVAIKAVDGDNIIIADPYHPPHPDINPYPKSLIDSYRGTTIGISVNE